ncbi:MAG: hypothetical protein ABIW94_03950 [Gemmatimonadaceae bacterium]
MPHDLVPFGFFAMVTIVAIGTPLVRGIVKRWERNDATPQVPGDVSARMERMEHAIDAIAVEIERISEGQRFTTKLLSETRKPDALHASSRSAN